MESNKRVMKSLLEVAAIVAEAPKALENTRMIAEKVIEIVKQN